jgi:hypothetical protein
VHQFEELSGQIRVALTLRSPFESQLAVETSFEGVVVGRWSPFQLQCPDPNHQANGVGLTRCLRCVFFVLSRFRAFVIAVLVLQFPAPFRNAPVSTPKPASLV